MARRRNLLPLAGVVVCAAAFFSYPLFFVRFPLTRDVPWANWLLFAVGLWLAGVGLVRAFRRSGIYRGRVLAPISGVLCLAVLAFFVFMTEVASRQLPASAKAPRVGEKAPDFTLSDAHGKPVRLSDLLERGSQPTWALLIFYRGYW